MKSINEFATKYAQDKYLPVQTSQAVKAGANYVLVVIKDSLAEFNNTEDYSILQRKIKELKGE